MDAVTFHVLHGVAALVTSFALYSVAAALCAFACLLGLLCYIKFKQRETSGLMEKFPGQAEWIPMLNAWLVYRAISKEAHRLDVGIHLFQTATGGNWIFQKQGMLRLYDAAKPILVLFKADPVEEVLTSNAVLKKGHEYELIKPWLGTGLLTSTGTKWRSRRKLLTPAFHFRILEDFLPTLNDQSEILVQKLARLEKDRSCDIVPLITLCALDIICETIMGYTVNAQSNKHSEYVQAIQVVGRRFARRLESPLYCIDAIFRVSKRGREYHQKIGELHRFTMKVIRERKRKLLSCPELREAVDETTSESDVYALKGKARNPFLDILLREHIKDPENFTEEDVREEVDTFMFEGHDTTAVGMSWALYLIGLYPEHQELIHQELDAIFGSNKTRPVTSDDLKQMKYMECCLKESQRLYPSVPFISRKCEEDLMIAGRKLPKGTNIQIGIYNLHRDPEEFPKPEEFIPDRFFPENVKGRHAFAFVPFSAGPRNCIVTHNSAMSYELLFTNYKDCFVLLSASTALNTKHCSHWKKLEGEDTCPVFTVMTTACEDTYNNCAKNLENH